MVETWSRPGGQKAGCPAAGRATDWRFTGGGVGQGREGLFRVDGKVPVRVRAMRPAQFGVNYLRMEFRAEADAGHVTIGQLSAQLPR